MFLSRFLISNLFSVFLVGAILLLKKVLKNRVTYNKIIIKCKKNNINSVGKKTIFLRLNM